jgi:uncharacterized protein YhhL (DUF1145 family)
MPEPYPNHFVSIPRSLWSLKHYFQVHDQPFTRSLLYLVLVAVSLTLLVTGVSVVDFARMANDEAKEVAEKLSVVRFADIEQPARLLKTRAMLVVLDTTGKLNAMEEAAEFAGCVQSRHMIFFGRAKITSIERPAERRERPKQEEVDYADDKKLTELRELIEEQGASLPKITVENGLAKFDLAPNKVHVLVHTAALMVLVDTAAEERTMQEALTTAVKEDPALLDRFVPPEFLVLITSSEVSVRSRFQPEAQKWGFAGQPNLTPQAVAEWIAAAARQARVSATFRAFLPNLVQGCLMLFILALLLSASGLIVSGVLKAGLAYVELLTMAVYAVTPASLSFLLAASVLRNQAPQWVIAVPIVVGALYTASATHRTARELRADFAPKL